MQILYYNGKPLVSARKLSRYGVEHGSRLELLGRMRGGGGDGGSTGAESRSAYLDMYKEKKTEKVRLSGARKHFTTRHDTS